MRKVSISLYDPPFVINEECKWGPPRLAVVEMEQLLDSLSTLVEFPNKVSANAWSPIHYSGTRRLASAAISACALVFDIDNPQSDRGRLVAQLQELDWVYVLHDTFTAGRFRLVIPLAVDVLPNDYHTLRTAVASKLVLEHDPSCSDLARLFFIPSAPEGQSKSRTVLRGGSTFLNPRDYLIAKKRSVTKSDTVDKTVTLQQPEKSVNLSDIQEELGQHSDPLRRKQLVDFVNGTLVIPTGERERILHPLLSTLSHTRNAPSEETVRELLHRVLCNREGADTQLENWIEKGMYSYRRGLQRKATLDAQKAELESFFHNDDWKGSLKMRETKEGVVIGAKPLEHNIITILENDPAFKGHVRWNLLKNSIEITGGVLAHQPIESLDVPLAAWFQRSQYNCDVSTGVAGTCLQHVALHHSYDPVKEFLMSLPRWDQVPRLAQILFKFAKAEGARDWIPTITMKFFVAAIARALSPGCQVDNTLVLQGAQGGGKTSFVRVMGAGFHVETSLDLHNKDAVMTSASNWLVELGELASLKKSDVESVRNFLTRKEDQIRLPYGRMIKTMPRRCVFVGTTNSRQPLTDPEGSRRFWVVSVGTVDVQGLLEIRDQLWAEALHLYNNGFEWWLSQEEAKRAAEEATPYEAEDINEMEILHWLDGLSDWPETIDAAQIAKKVMGRLPGALSTQEVASINRTLTKFGWKQSRRRVAGRQVRCFEVPPRREVLGDE